MSFPMDKKILSVLQINYIYNPTEIEEIAMNADLCVEVLQSRLFIILTTVVTD
jgi:hypothetical protein